jgi:thioredoxin 1
MQSPVKSTTILSWLALSAAAVLLLAGCLGRSGLFSPGAESHDSLEHVTDATFEERVLKCDKPVLVDFYAEWCGPCKQLTPIVEEFAGEHPEFRIVKVNVDDCTELAKRYQVDAMPTLLAFRGGKVVQRSLGWVPKSKIKKMMTEDTEERAAADGARRAT